MQNKEKKQEQIKALEARKQSLQNKEKNLPTLKVKKGRFQLTEWKQQRIRGSGHPDSTGYTEKEVTVTNLCLSYSKKINGKWINQNLWFHPDELRDISILLEKWDEAIEKRVDEGDSPSDSLKEVM